MQGLTKETQKFLEDKNLIVASNRGPVEFYKTDNGKIGMNAGAGGIVPTLVPIMEKVGGTWIASAMNDTDREVAQKFPENRIPIPRDNPKFWVPLILLDPEKYNEFYNFIHNPLLWFIHHYMWDLAYTPEIDDYAHKAWESYKHVNMQFADKIVEEIKLSDKEPLIMLQDTHLQTCPAYIREKIDDIFLSQFIHIPWPQPDYFTVFPRNVQKDIIEGLLSNDHLGFHIKRYVKNFLMSCENYADEVDFNKNIVHYDGRDIFVKDYPISVDSSKLEELAKSEEVLKQEEYVRKIKGDNFLIYRTERTDPSKNIIRGFKAYDLFFQKYPDFKEKVTFFITGRSTRENVKEYQDYKVLVNETIEKMNKKYAADSKNGWKPIVPHFDAEYSLVTAALKNYDCLLINSIHDGMNIVPKEGSAVNETNGVLIISETTGAYDEFKDYSLNINAFDISETADAIYKAVTMNQEERKKRSKGLKDTIKGYNVYRWMEEQFEDIQKIF